MSRSLTCQQVEELAGLYVLDALEAQEADAVAAHLAACPDAHATYQELASTASSLPMTIPDVAPPPELRDRLLASIAASPQVPDVIDVVPGAATDDAGDAKPWPIDALLPPDGATSFPAGQTVAPTQHRRSGWSWLGLAAGLVAIVFVAAGILGALQLDAERSDLFRRAVAAATDASSNVAVLTGADAAAGAIGYAVFPEGEAGFVVIDGLPQIGTGQAYQTWYVGDGDPVSAGLIELSADGLGTLTGLEPVPGTVVVAVTVEERPGAQAPTSTPVIVGELPTATA